MKSMNELARKIAINEGKKKEVQIGDIKEIIRLMALVLAQDGEAFVAFIKYGERVVKQEDRKNSKR